MPSHAALGTEDSLEDEYELELLSADTLPSCALPPQVCPSPEH